MGASTNALLFSLAFFFLSSQALNQQSNGGATAATVVHVLNAMPRGSEPMQIRCNSKNKDLGVQSLGVGDSNQWKVEEKALIFYCAAIWRRQIASWHAFQPRRDMKHEQVFWLVKEDGFFHSWDNSSWVRRSLWETE